jgi:hypothetical protein
MPAFQTEVPPELFRVIVKDEQAAVAERTYAASTATPVL